MKLDIYSNNTYEEEVRFPTYNNARTKKYLKHKKMFRKLLEKQNNI